MKYRLKFGLAILFSMISMADLYAMDEKSLKDLPIAQESPSVAPAQDNKDNKRQANDRSDNNGSRKKIVVTDKDSIHAVAAIVASPDKNLFHPIDANSEEKVKILSLDELRLEAQSIVTVRASTVQSTLEFEWWWDKNLTHVDFGKFGQDDDSK